MTQVQVYHSGEHVANVNYPHPLTDVSHALEYAYRWTNNIDGSWSIKDRELEYRGDMLPNNDYNENVEVVAPLHEHLGRKYGHRSSMMGDVFKIDGEEYTVASFGFKNSKGEQV